MPIIVEHFVSKTKITTINNQSELNDIITLYDFSNITIKSNSLGIDTTLSAVFKAGIFRNVNIMDTINDLVIQNRVALATLPAILPTKLTKARIKTMGEQGLKVKPYDRDGVDDLVTRARYEFDFKVIGRINTDFTKSRLPVISGCVVPWEILGDDILIPNQHKVQFSKLPIHYSTLSIDRSLTPQVTLLTNPDVTVTVDPISPLTATFITIPNTYPIDQLQVFLRGFRVPNSMLTIAPLQPVVPGYTNIGFSIDEDMWVRGMSYTHQVLEADSAPPAAKVDYLSQAYVQSIFDDPRSCVLTIETGRFQESNVLPTSDLTIADSTEHVYVSDTGQLLDNFLEDRYYSISLPPGVSAGSKGTIPSIEYLTELFVG